MNDRDKAIIERIENSLRQEGYVEIPIRLSMSHGYGDFESFFQLMVDLRLQGKKEVTAEEVWTNMRMQVLDLANTIRQAGKDYTKLANRYRDLETEYYELIKKQKGSQNG